MSSLLFNEDKSAKIVFLSATVVGKVRCVCQVYLFEVKEQCGEVSVSGVEVVFCESKPF